MDLRVCVVLLAVWDAAFGQDGYGVAFSRDVNTFTLTCFYTTNNVQSGSVSNPEWYFDASFYKNHTCTQDGTRGNGGSLTVTLTPECEGFIQCGDGKALSIPEPLLTYPTLLDNKNDRIINATVGDQIVIPCGIRVSATDNFEICWTEQYFLSDNLISKNYIGPLNQEYGLIIESLPNRNSTYFCVATAKPSSYLKKDLNLEVLVGPSNKVFAMQYGMPEIQVISVETVNRGAMFTVDKAMGTPSNKYTWSRNNVVLDGADVGVTINPSPPFLRLDTVSNGDVIGIEATNTNIHGETSSDRVLVFLFTLASSSSSTTTTGDLMPSPAVIRSSNCNPFATNQMAGILNVIFIVVCLLIFFAAVILVIYGRCYKKESSHHKNDDNSLIVSIGDSEVVLNKSKMTNLKDFFRKIDLIIGTTVDKMKEECRLDEQILTNIDELRIIIMGWEESREKRKEKSRKEGKDNIRFDGSTSVSYNIECKTINELSSAPAGLGYYDYKVPADEKTVSRDHDLLNEDDLSEDVFSVLLPSLSKMRKAKP